MKRISPGRRCSMADAQIAAICRCHEAKLATRNVAAPDSWMTQRTYPGASRA